MMCHLPLLMPLAGLVLFAVLPPWTALAVYLPLTLVSLGIGLSAVSAMYRPVLTGAEGMRDKPAVVVSSAGRSGTLLCEGELWRFRSPAPVGPQERVRIVAVEGLVTIARPLARSEGGPRG